MSIKFTSNKKYFLKLVLPFVLLFQWTMPTLEKKRNIHINFSDIIIEKCNDPEHSHPPLSQRETPEDPEKLVNSYLENSFLVYGYQNYFDISFKVIFDKPEKFPDFLFTHFPPARGPPHIEV